MNLDLRFWAAVTKTEDCWTWGRYRDRRGYGRIMMPDHVPALAHRVAWELERGPIPAGLFVLHHCDNPPCVRPDHLFLGTQADNMRDCHSKGRHSISDEARDRQSKRVASSAWRIDLVKKDFRIKPEHRKKIGMRLRGRKHPQDCAHCKAVRKVVLTNVN